MSKQSSSNRRQACRLTVLSGLMAAGMIVAAAAQATGAPAQAWATTSTRAHDPGAAVHVGRLADDAQVEVVVSLKLRNKAQLDALTDALMSGRGATPLSREEFMARHAPTDAQVRAVVDYLRAQGFTRIEPAANNLLVTASGSAAAVQHAFHAELHEYDVDGRRARANVTDALVPAALSDTVLAIGGLQTVHIAHVTAQLQPRAVAPQFVSTVAETDYPSIYGASTLPSASNATIAIIAEGNLAQTVTDLRNFASHSGFPSPTVTTTVVSSSNDTNNTVEWNLDSQTALAAAGGTVKGIVLYDIASLSDGNLTAGYNRAVADNTARTINVSLEECETSASARSAQDAIFQSAIAQGQTFSVASGDNGAYECGAGGGFAQSWPAASPYVIAVGGTTLDHTNGTYNGETAWSCSSAASCQNGGGGSGGGGGGPSITEAAPSWQTAAGVLNGSTRRGVPDIAFDAAPASGAVFLLNGGWTSVGGTSLAAPLWTGFWSRIQSAHGNGLPFPAQTLYAGAATHPTWFHDVVSGNQGYAAGVGWDYATGYGSLQVGNFSTAFATGGAGTFSFVSGTHTARDSGGDIATTVIKNTGPGPITNIVYSCAANSSSAGSWHQYSNPPAPSALAAGATGTFVCQAAASGMFSVYVTLTGTNASNSPMSVSY